MILSLCSSVRQALPGRFYTLQLGRRLSEDVWKFSLLIPLFLAPEHIIDFQERAIGAPLIEVVAHGAGGRKVVRDQTPLAAGAVDIHQGIDHAPQIDRPRPSRTFLRADDWVNQGPLLVGQVGQVTHRYTPLIAF